MEILENVIFGTFIITASVFFFSAWVYVPFYVFLLYKHDRNNKTHFPTELWWNPAGYGGVVIFFVQKKFRIVENRWIKVHGEILTWLFGYTLILMVISVISACIFMYLVDPPASST